MDISESYLLVLLSLASSCSGANLLPGLRGILAIIRVLSLA